MSKKFYLWMLFAVFFTAAAMGVHAADLYVTTTADQVPGSLRVAITTANNNGEDDTIHLPAGTYVLEGTVGEDANASGDLDIDTLQGITINGAGIETTIIDGNQADRILHIIRGTVSIDGVTFQHGKPRDGQSEGEKGEDGGGILNSGTLSLINCQLKNNRGGNGFYSILCSCSLSGGNGGSGGAIYNDGTLTINKCLMYDNAAGDCGVKNVITSQIEMHPGHGGAIFNSETGALVLKDSTIYGNESGNAPFGRCDNDFFTNGGDGGGICNYGTQELTNCKITSNKTGTGGEGDPGHGEEGRSGQGGAIYNSGKSRLTKCIIKNNATGVDPNTINIQGVVKGGGGIYNTGTLSLSECTISYNSTGYGGSGGGIYHQSGTLTLVRCAVTNNSTGDGIMQYPSQQGGSGGGLFNESTSTITNCTFSNNKTGAGAPSETIAANGGDGAGICNKATITLIHNTICNNTTGEGGDGIYPAESVNGRGGSGGGIYNSAGSTFNIKNTIVADNTIAAGGEGEDAWGIFNSQGYNLIENTSHCTITGILTGNITGVDPLLGPLTNNGGPTQTHTLIPGSPAIDAGNSFGSSTDQRSYTRPVDIPGLANASDGADIGAYELKSLNFITISGKITHDGNGLADVTLTFSGDAGTATSDQQGNYEHMVEYGWTGTVTPSLSWYTFTPSSRSYTHVTSTRLHQDYTALPIPPPQISLNRTHLNFNAEINGPQTETQRFVIANIGGRELNWTISDNAHWLNCTPSSGSGPGLVSVSVDISTLSLGAYSGVISVEDPNAVNSPQTITVSLHVNDQGQTSVPFGEFATPLDGATVSGSIPVTGWALDDIGVANVKIYNGDAYIGDAVLVEGARPDIEVAYPTYPNNYKAGWGYMLLTNCLPNGGNGTYTLTAKAIDMEENEVILGSKTITIDNAHAVKPFGAIDTPVQGGTASGTKFINNGWALTPQPNTIPIDGSTITVVIDGEVKGHPIYNIYRWDIAWYFPGYANSNNAAGYYYLDTTKLKNSVHTIAWIVTDNAGNSDGIGSRYFTVQNSGNSGDRVQESGVREKRRGAPACAPIFDPCAPFFESCASDFDSHSPSFAETTMVEIKELERVEINLTDEGVFEGYLVVGDRLRELPIGSTLDIDKGIFYWQPGPGFLGDFHLVFIKTDSQGKLVNKNIWITIIPSS